MYTYGLHRCAVSYVDLVMPETVMKANVDAECVDADEHVDGALASLIYYYSYRHFENHC